MNTISLAKRLIDAYADDEDDNLQVAWTVYGTIYLSTHDEQSARTVGIYPDEENTEGFVLVSDIVKMSGRHSKEKDIEEFVADNADDAFEMAKGMFEKLLTLKISELW